MQVNLGLIQLRAGEQPQTNLERTLGKIREAAGQGAQVICTQELFLTRYFCREQDPKHFDLAEPIPGPTTEILGGLARELEVVIVASLFEKRGSEIYHNTAAIIDADGAFLGAYRKMHIPQDPGFEEKFYFTPGDLGYRTWHTRYGKLGVLVCWDQWYPEAARLTALSGADILIYPTAIGWLPTEKAELGRAQHTAWETVQRGHAVANGCYVAAINRVGTEGTPGHPAGEIEFWGQSFIADPYGEVLARAPEDREATLVTACDLKRLSDMRRIWPFFRDRRIDSYDGLRRRLID